jgi:hypothetical protein
MVAFRRKNREPLQIGPGRTAADGNLSAEKRDPGELGLMDADGILSAEKRDPGELGLMDADGSLSTEIPGPRRVGLAGRMRMVTFRPKNRNPGESSLTGRMNQSRP